MKVQEFIEKKKVLKNQPVKAMLNVKEYLPFAEKKALAEKIVDTCVNEENGAIKINEIDKYIVFTIESIKSYTDLEFDEDMTVATSEYDQLCETGLLNDIVASFSDEYKVLLELVKMQTDYVMQDNSVEYQLAKFLHGINNNLDSLAGILSNKIADFSLESLGVGADDIQKLLGFASDFMK